jgi:plastocyanin
MIMAATFKPGDAVRWSSHGSTAHGKVVKKQTSPTDIKGHHVAASKEDPQYIVATDDGKRAAHRPAALRRD